MTTSVEPVELSLDRCCWELMELEVNSWLWEEDSIVFSSLLLLVVLVVVVVRVVSVLVMPDMLGSRNMLL